MTSYHHLSRKSKNEKLGGIASSTSSADTCSSSCGMFKECYAKHGPQKASVARIGTHSALLLSLSSSVRCFAIM
jgi:hypothetical protein